MPDAINWSALTPRQRDALIAEHLMGYHVQWIGGDVWIVPPPSAEDQDVALGRVPEYSTRAHGGPMAEQEIERRGSEAQSDYAWILKEIVGVSDDFKYDATAADLWKVIRATPEQRCRAALIAIGVLDA